METKNQMQERLLQEIKAKVIAFHNDKDKAKTEIIKRGYFNALCPTLAEKARFYEDYRQKFPEDTATLKMIEEELKKQREKEENRSREKYPQSVPEIATVLAGDMTNLAGKALGQMIDNFKQSNKSRLNNRYVSFSDNAYYGESVGLEGFEALKIGSASKRRFNIFGLFGGRRENAKPMIERVSIATTQAERLLMQNKIENDARLQRYNESVKQRAMQRASEPASQRVNSNVMAR